MIEKYERFCVLNIHAYTHDMAIKFEEYPQIGHLGLGRFRHFGLGRFRHFRKKSDRSKFFTFKGAESNESNKFSFVQFRLLSFWRPRPPTI